MSIESRRISSGNRRYDVRLRRPDGTTYTRTLRTRKEAESYERSERTARERGSWTDPRAGTMTFARYATDWLEDRTVRGKAIAPRTAESYRYLLDRYLLPEYGTTPLNKVTRQSVRTWHARLTRQASASVPPKAYRLLHGIMASAADDGLIGANPCRIKGAGAERTAERPTLGVAEVTALADGIEPRWRAMVLLAAYGELRFGELLGLRRRDVDLLHRRVIVAEQLIELPNSEQVRTPPKSEAGRRKVTLPVFVAEELSRHLDTYVPSDVNAPLFTGTRGAIPLRRNWARIWARARATAGLPAGVHLHDLRHAGATLAAQTGATTKELMARLGHASPRAALIYQHAAQDRDQTIADQLDRLIQAHSDSLNPDGTRDGRAMEP